MDRNEERVCEDKKIFGRKWFGKVGDSLKALKDSFQLGCEDGSWVSMSERKEAVTHGESKAHPFAALRSICITGDSIWETVDD